MKLANIAKLATASVGLSTLAMNSAAFAAADAAVDTTTTSGLKFGASHSKIESSIVGTTSLTKTIQDMTSYLSGFLALVAVLYGIYGGYLYLTAGGEEEQTKKAKTIFKQVAVGLLIIFLSYSIVSFFMSLMSSSSGGTGIGGNVTGV